MSIDLRQFHASFFSESLEGLDATEANLLRLEGGERSPELLNAIFRAIHSIKGAAGSLGFPQIGRFTQGGVCLPGRDVQHPPLYHRPGGPAPAALWGFHSKSAS